MSIVAFKKKSVIQHGTHISGRNPGGLWISRGPGKHGVYANNSGFSINGPYRNKGLVGTTMQFSKTKTLFRGPYAVGWGGLRGRYYHVPLMAVNEAIIVPGTQQRYVKPSVLSTYGLLQTKYKWINGQFPNYWVKNIYTNTMSDNASQELYIRNKASASSCQVINKPFIGNQNIKTESEYIVRLTHRCADPLPHQIHKPEPFRTACVGGGGCV